MKRGLTLVLALLIVAVFAFALTSCGEDEHEHTYSDKWTVDENNHWHVATCEHTDKISSKGGHVDSNGDGACDMCGNGGVHMHTYTDAWTSDETGHWHMATCTGHTSVKGDVYKHFNENGDGACDLCGYAVCYSVTVNAPEVVDAPAVVYVDKTTGTATFEVSVSDLYVLSATGATQKGDVVTENGENVYTYELTDIKADGEVTLATKQVKFVELISENTETVALTGSWMGLRGIKEITLNLEKGNYMLVGSAEGGLEISFMDEDYMDSSKLEVEEAGEVKVTLAATDYDSGNFEEGDEVEVEYSVLAIPTTEIAVEEFEGEGLTFPTNVNMYLTFTAPEAGMYVFTSEAEGVIWNDDISICVAYAAEAGAELTVFVTAREIEGYSYEFDWKVEKLTTSGTVADGDTVTINYGEYTVVEFTADADGSYNFSMANANSEVRYYNAEYDFLGYASMADMKLAEGDKVILYIANNEDVDYDGEDTITDTFVVEYKKLLPSYTVTITNDDTYGYNVSYTFTADVSGSYTFYFPADLGVYTPEAYESWGAPIIDFGDNYGGFEYTVDIPADGTITLLYGATYADDFVIEYEVEEKEVSVGGGEEDDEESTILAAGSNTITVTDADKTAGVKEYTFTPEVSGDHKFTGDFVVTILNGTSPVVGVSGYYTLEAGVEYTVQLGLSLVSVGTATLTINAPQAPSGNALQLGVNAGTANMGQAMSGVECTFTAPQTATYAFATENVNYMLMNGTMPMTQTMDLEEGQTITFVAYLMGAGNYSITISISTGEGSDVADGSESNPYTLETLGEINFNSDTINKVYYLYTATESGTLTITYSTADSWADCYEKVGEDQYDGANSQSSEEEQVASFTVEAGKTYRIGIGTWAVEGETTVTVAFVA